MSVSPSSRKRKVGESNPIQPRCRGDWLATRFLSQFGYLPYFSGPTGNRTRISATPGRCRPVGPSARKVERRGIEPRLPGCKPSVFPLDERPKFKRSVRELNPVFRLTTAACGRNTYRPVVKVIPGRIELPISWVSSRRLRHWTTGS